MYTVISLGGDASWTGSQHLMTVGDWLWQAYAVPQHHMVKNGDVLLTEFYPRYAGYLSHPHQPILFWQSPPRLREVLPSPFRVNKRRT